MKTIKEEHEEEQLEAEVAELEMALSIVDRLEVLKEKNRIALEKINRPNG